MQKQRYTVKTYCMETQVFNIINNAPLTLSQLTQIPKRWPIEPIPAQHQRSICSSDTWSYSKEKKPHRWATSSSVCYRSSSGKEPQEVLQWCDHLATHYLHICTCTFGMCACTLRPRAYIYKLVTSLISMYYYKCSLEYFVVVIRHCPSNDACEFGNADHS